MDATYRDDIKALQEAGYNVQWGHWSLTACRMVNGTPVTDVVSVGWPVGNCGPCDADTAIRNRVAKALREKVL